MTQDKTKKKKPVPAEEAPRAGRHSAGKHSAGAVKRADPVKKPKKGVGPKKAVSTKKGRKRRKGAAKKPALTLRTILKRVGLSVLTLLILVLVGALGAGRVAFKGPSQSLGDLLTVSMLETSALKFVPRIYYNDAEMDAIIARNSVDSSVSETDTSMIVIAGPTPEPGSEAALSATPKPSNLLYSEDGIEIFDVEGATYNGWMMVVQDPSRVVTGVCRENFNSKPGLELYEIAERYGAVAAINGGGFSDSGGVGNGGMPTGLVIAGGEVLNKSGGSSDHNVVVGFNQDNVMIIGEMTSKQALDKGIRDALAFGPALVVNGEAARVKGSSSGLNPRTAIGQRADGAVLMLVIDGRQASSLGATYADLISVMLEYGAVNAINLDGGSSSLMYYRGEYLNKGVILTGSRKMPTGFVVK
ncbi:MAG: phosphodiester glycosidase family protein [Clostridia bacterium]|nr:phosphodiester glycosidase family protein [Clostridia bacterium]MBR1561562.1 phosphodiester glycosidase family protein [Clostridia bacterium]